LDTILRKGHDGSGSPGQAHEVEQAERPQDEREHQAEGVLKRLELVNAFDLDGAKSSLEASFLANDELMEFQDDGGIGEQLEGSGPGGPANRKVVRKLVVIDSIGSILGPCLSTGDSHGTDDLTEGISRTKTEVMSFNHRASQDASFLGRLEHDCLPEWNSLRGEPD
jgi:hypothetical protein